MARQWEFRVSVCAAQCAYIISKFISGDVCHRKPNKQTIRWLSCRSVSVFRMRRKTKRKNETYKKNKNKLRTLQTSARARVRDHQHFRGIKMKRNERLIAVAADRQKATQIISRRANEFRDEERVMCYEIERHKSPAKWLHRLLHRNS